MAYDPILAAEVDAESPQDENLWGKVKGNFEALYAAIGAQFNIYADGSDSSYSSSGSGTITAVIRRHTSFIVNSGHTIDLTGGPVLVIIATDSITINGTLAANGIADNGASSRIQTFGGDGGTGGAGTGGGGGASELYDGGRGGGADYLKRLVAGGNPGASVNGAGGNGSTHPVEHAAAGLFHDFRIGGGGASGGGNVGYSSGAGGDGGGCIVLVSPTIIIGGSGVVSANGSVGSNGQGGSGAGGGGGGGSIFIYGGTFTDNGTLEADGGASGTGGPVGGSGGAGIIKAVEF